MKSMARGTSKMIVTVWRKIRERGWRWFWLRVAEKTVHPHSAVGRYVNPIVARAQKLRPGLMSSGASRQIAPMSRTLFLFYDLQVAPITFNVIDDLIAAELMRRRLNLADIHVVIVPGRNEGLRWEDAEYDVAVDRATRYWRLYNIVIASFPLLPSCSGYTLCSSRQQATDIQRAWSAAVYPEGYTVALPVPPLRRLLTERARAGEKVFPGFVTPTEAMRFMRRRLEVLCGARRPVVLTLRGYGYMPQRNAQPEIWAEFARSLDPERYIPIFVPDTHAIPEPIPEVLKGFAMMPEVAVNILLRMALYECAWLNMANMHGPMALCWYNERCRYVIFQAVGTAPQTSREALETDGYVLGEQLPWATSLQRWVWEKESVDNLRYHFAEMEKLIEAN
jgi:hypothetical protein